MKKSVRGVSVAAVVGVAALAVSLGMLLGAKPAASQSDAGGKKFCVGCSVDGTTTPQTADGHPDFNGYWGGGNVPAPGAQGGRGGARGGGAAGAAARGGAARGGGGGGGRTVQKAPDGSILFDFSTEYNVNPRCNPLDESCQVANQPPYNDVYMKKVREIAATEFQGTTPLDPNQSCRAEGVPRAGFPEQIVQTPDVILFLYSAAPYTTFRIIYTNGRPHPDPKDYETSYFGDSIGHWEGDTLVVDTVGFNDDTWLGGGGATGNAQFTSVHSEKEHVTERLTRNGDVMTYDVMVEDPEALTKAWVLATRRIRHSGPGMEIPGDDAIYEEICEPTRHFVQPSPEDTDIKNKCGYRCDKPLGTN